MSGRSEGNLEQVNEKRAPELLPLTTIFCVEDNHLRFSYQVHNRNDRDVYLLNRLFHSTPKFMIDPNLIYIHLVAKTDTVWLHKKIHDIPSDRNVLSPVSPFVTPVRSGSAYSEQIAIPLPLREYREYSMGRDPNKGRTRTFHNIYFSLGYYWASPGTKEEERNIQGYKVILPQLPPGTKVEWGVANGPLMKLDIAAIEPQS